MQLKKTPEVLDKTEHGSIAREVLPAGDHFGSKLLSKDTVTIKPISPSIIVGAVPCTSQLLRSDAQRPVPALLSSRIDHGSALCITIAKYIYSDLQLLAIWQLASLSLLKNLEVFFSLIKTIAQHNTDSFGI